MNRQVVRLIIELLTTRHTKGKAMSIDRGDSLKMVVPTTLAITVTYGSWDACFTLFMNWSRRPVLVANQSN